MLADVLGVFKYPAVRLFDTALEVYLGSCSTLSLLACNDDNCGLQSQIDITGIPTGTLFIIRVGGWNGATGAGSLTLTETSSFLLQLRRVTLRPPRRARRPDNRFGVFTPQSASAVPVALYSSTD